METLSHPRPAPAGWGHAATHNGLVLGSLPQLQLLSEPHERHPGAGTPPASAGSRAGPVPGSVQGWQGSRQHRATPVPSTELGHSPRGATTDLPGPPTPPGGADGTPEATRRQLMSPPAHQQRQGWLPTSCLGAREGLYPPRGHRDRATGSVRAAKAPAGRKEPALHMRPTAQTRPQGTTALASAAPHGQGRTWLGPWGCCGAAMGLRHPTLEGSGADPAEPTAAGSQAARRRGRKRLTQVEPCRRGAGRPRAPSPRGAAPRREQMPTAPRPPQGRGAE